MVGLATSAGQGTQEEEIERDKNNDVQNYVEKHDDGPAPLATPPQPPSQPTSASGAFTTEAIIGVVVGSVVVLIAGGGVFWCASSFFMPACPPRPPAPLRLPPGTPRRHSACADKRPSTRVVRQVHEEEARCRSLSSR